MELVQEPLHEADRYGTGTTFLFSVNNVKIFVGGTPITLLNPRPLHLIHFKGSNWIPADNFLTTIRPEKYRAWLQLLKDGNQNMVRLWGGGIYEPDCFYDICDGKPIKTLPAPIEIAENAIRVGDPRLAGFSVCVWGLPCA